MDTNREERDGIIIAKITPHQLMVTANTTPVTAHKSDSCDPSTGVESGKNRAVILLQQQGLRSTRSRRQILEVLAKQTQPITILDLHAALGPQACDIVTVYRCMTALVNSNQVRRSYNYGGTCMYELATADRPRQYHIVCRECGGIEPLEHFPLDAAYRHLQSRGYNQLTHVVEFFGVCPNCADSESAALTRMVIRAARRSGQPKSTTSGN